MRKVKRVRLSRLDLDRIFRAHSLWVSDTHFASERVTLAESRLERANLTYHDLSHMDLSGINLYDADLSYANLTESDLMDTDLRYADLTGAIFTDELHMASSLFGCKMSWDKASWFTLHDEFKDIQFV